MELEAIVQGLDCRSSSQGSAYDSSARFSDCISLHLDYHFRWEVHWQRALGDLPHGGGGEGVFLSRYLGVRSELGLGEPSWG